MWVAARAAPFETTSPPRVQEALAQLWVLCFPDGGPAPDGKSERWKDAGFQGTDPATDFRGGGIFALSNLLHLGRAHPASFQRLLHKRDGERADAEYPFCVAGARVEGLRLMVGVKGVQRSDGSERVWR